jgi:hypothetical protein
MATSDLVSVVGFQAPPVWKVVFSFLRGAWLLASVAYRVERIAVIAKKKEGLIFMARSS